MSSAFSKSFADVHFELLGYIIYSGACFCDRHTDTVHSISARFAPSSDRSRKKYCIDTAQDRQYLVYCFTEQWWLHFAYCVQRAGCYSLSITSITRVDRASHVCALRHSCRSVVAKRYRYILIVSSLFFVQGWTIL